MKTIIKMHTRQLEGSVSVKTGKSGKTLEADVILILSPISSAGFIVSRWWKNKDFEGFSPTAVLTSPASEQRNVDIG